MNALAEKLADAAVEAEAEESGNDGNIFLSAAKQAEKKKRRGESQARRQELASDCLLSANKAPDSTPQAPVPPVLPVDTGPKTSACHKCKEVFESRTKLFDHLKLTGHATIKVPQPPPKNKKGRRN